MTAVTIRRIRYAMVAVALAVLAWTLWQARGALVPFVVGGVLAFALAPLVERIARTIPFHRRRRELARTIAIILVYLSGLGVLVSAGSIMVPAIVNETGDFIDQLPELVEQSRREGEKWTDRYRERVPEDVQLRVENAVRDLGNSLGAYASAAASRTFGVLRNTFGLIFGYIIVPFWLFYVLKDRHKIGPTIQGWFPPGLRRDVDACIRIIQRVLGSYIRAQLTLGLFIGTLTVLGLWALDVQYFVILGIIAGITELIPIIGPILGAIPALIVVLATDPHKVIWVLLFYVVLQQLENIILVPRIQGNAVEMHPAVIIVLLAIAQQLAGFSGMLVAVPLAAVSRDLFKYIYSRLREREAELELDQTTVLRRPRDGRVPAGRGDNGAPSDAPATEAARGER